MHIRVSVHIATVIVFAGACRAPQSDADWSTLAVRPDRASSRAADSLIQPTTRHALRDHYERPARGVRDIRARGQLVALLTTDSVPILLFLHLTRTGGSTSGEELRVWPGETRPALGRAVRLLAFGDSQNVVFHDDRYGRLTSSDIGGRRYVVRPVTQRMADSTICAVTATDVHADSTQRLRSAILREARVLAVDQSACLFRGPDGELATLDSGSTEAVRLPSIRDSTGRVLYGRPLAATISPAATALLVHANAEHRSVVLVAGRSGAPVMWHVSPRIEHIALGSTDLIAIAEYRDSVVAVTYPLPEPMRWTPKPMLRAPGAPKTSAAQRP